MAREPINLAEAGNRRPAQGRVTNNRDTVIPTRRLVEAPQLRNREDMRNARRDDGEVDAVRRALGMVSDAAGDFGQAYNAQAKETAIKDAAQGRADEAMGQVDESKAAKSTAYRTAIAMSRARKRVAEVEMILKPEVEDLLSRGADADPTRGEQPVDLEDVNELIEARFRSLVIDEKTGKPIDFGDPAANLEVYGALETLRPKLLTGAQEIIRQQEAEKVVRGFSDELETVVLRGGEANIEDFMSRLPPGVDRNKARSALLEALVNGAEQAEDPSVILKAADSRRADGTPSWTPQQEGHLRDTARRLGEELDRKRETEAKERSAATLGELSVQVRSGRRLSPLMVQELISNGRLRPEDAELAFAVQERVDDEAREQVMQRRSDISWAQSQADRARSLRESSDTANMAEVQGLRAAMIRGDLAPAQAHREATKLFATGRISIKTYDFLVDEAKKLPTNEKAVKDAGAEVYEARLRRIIGTSRTNVGKPGKLSEGQFNLYSNTAQVTFYRELRQGAEPQVALVKALQEFPGISLNQAVSEAAAARKRSSQ